MIKNLLASMWASAMDYNKKNILSLLYKSGHRKCSFLDLGCDDGEWTMECAKALNAKKVAGVDIVESALKLARNRGVKTIKADLSKLLPIKSSTVDVIHANQVIEHVSSIDNFAKEIYRILRPGGGAIISTENASSWVNIFAMILGWQMFSLTNLSSVRSGIGNPASIHRGSVGEMSSWTHKTIFSYLGLKEFFEAHRFKVKAISGAGYFPLPYWFGKLDKRHSHFLTILVTKI